MRELPSIPSLTVADLIVGNRLADPDPGIMAL